MNRHRRLLVTAVAGNGLRGSMCRVAADNAAMESFCALLRKNVLDRRRWTNRGEVAAQMVCLGKLTPVEYELAYAGRRRQAA